MLNTADAQAVLAPAWLVRLAPVIDKKRAHIVPNPAVIAAGDAPSTTRAARSIAFLGEIGARKGVPDLLEAARILQERGVAFTLVLAGEGDSDLANELRSRLPEPSSVELLGWIPPEQAHQLLLSTEIFCLPSHAEGLPMAVLEAMMSGCAVVTTPVGGIPDLVTDGVDAVLVSPGESGDLADALEELLDDNSLRLRIGDAGRNTASAQNGLSRVTESLANVYSDLGHPPEPTLGDPPYAKPRSTEAAIQRCAE
jgi:glycosyltransferase involved in cell wall biosynthesis